MGQQVSGSLDGHLKTIHKGTWYKIHGLHSRRALDSLKAETKVKITKQKNLSSIGWTGEFCFSGVFSVHSPLYQQHKPGIPEAALISCHRGFT